MGKIRYLLRLVYIAFLNWDAPDIWELDLRYCIAGKFQKAFSFRILVQYSVLNGLCMMPLESCFFAFNDWDFISTR